MRKPLSVKVFLICEAALIHKAAKIFEAASIIKAASINEAASLWEETYNHDTALILKLALLKNINQILLQFYGGHKYVRQPQFLRQFHCVR